MLDYSEFVKFSDECNRHYRTLLEFENKKIILIHEDDIRRLSEILPEEQALVMKSNALEKKRMELLSGIDSGKNYRTVIDEAPEEYREILENNYAELTELIRSIKELNDNAALVINSRLEKMRRKNPRGELNTYTAGGNVSHTDNYVRHRTFKA